MSHAFSSTDFDGVFSHQRLDVYRIALRFARWAYEQAHSFPRGKNSLKDHLLRATESIVLNIAEGAQQESLKMAKKHYRIALASAAECSAALDLLSAYWKASFEEGHCLINRIGAMLRKLAR